MKCYRESISDDLDLEMTEMLFKLLNGGCIDDPQEYMEYLTILKAYGFSKEDALSILNHLLYEEQIPN